jgi:flavin-dependent dehydrogenase
MKLWGYRGSGNPPVRLEPGATVVVIGAGPAGAFFGLHLLRTARIRGQELRVIILEGRPEVTPSHSFECPHKKGCNYCAGGLSPRLNDVLRGMGMQLPPELVKNEIRFITVHSFWKNIEFQIPAGRQMLAVYRGSLPSHRGDGEHNFDAYLLNEAVKEGAVLWSAEATDLDYSGAGKPRVTYVENREKRVIEADFVVFAGGVNHALRHRAEARFLGQRLGQLLPGFSPPGLRRALVFELELTPEHAGELDGEIFFFEYGSKSLPLEMCSLVPKGQFVTVVLIGPAIDRLVDHSHVGALIHQFLGLSHVQKLIPRPIKMENACVCIPSLVIRTARHPYGHRMAIIGDMATARLYKDGILTAHQTALALARTIVETGVDEFSLAQGYGTVVERIRADNFYGRWVFRFHNLIFRSSLLSRIIYQAIITERKNEIKANRQLERILWKIASGDDGYRNILVAMLHPFTLGSVVTRGFLITLRNYVTEQVFGLHWRGFGRFTTGVARERLDAKRSEYRQVLAAQGMVPPARLEFERMYSIKIRADLGAVADAIGQFGELNRQYFTPRFVTVRRIDGEPNQPGCVIQYRVVAVRFCFSLRLEKIVDQHYFIYSVQDGFARGGVLVFEIEKGRKGVGLLSIYVAFDFFRGNAWFSRPFWWVLRLLFPAFIHDVIWNHSLCQLKDGVETARQPVEPASRSPMDYEFRNPVRRALSRTADGAEKRSGHLDLGF